MGYKQYKIKCQTDDLVLKCVEEFLRHHPEMKEIKISEDQIANGQTVSLDDIKRKMGLNV